MAALIRWKLPLHGAPDGGHHHADERRRLDQPLPGRPAVRLQRVSGHRDTGATACPGDALYAQLPELRSAGGRPAARAAPRPRLRARVTARQRHRALRPTRAGDAGG